MDAAFVIEVIEEHFKVSIINKQRIPNDNLIYLVRCAAVLIMLENTHPNKIAALLNVHRTNIYHCKDAANEKLNNSSVFKKCYLECVAVVTEKEEAFFFEENNKLQPIENGL